MQATNTYPGCVGVLNGLPRNPLSAQEIAALLEDVSSVLKKLDQREVFFDGLVHAANMGRRCDELDRERLPKERHDNLAFVEGRVQAEGRQALDYLSGINAYVLGFAPNAPEQPIRERVAWVRKKIRKVRRGRPDEDSRVYMAVAVATLYREHFSKPPSSTPGSDFVYLLECVSKAVDGEVRENMHRLAEVALRIKVEEFSPGVTTYALPRFK